MGYLCLTVARQMEELLQEKLHNPSEELRNEVATVPTTNSVSERVFGSLFKSARGVIKGYQKHRKYIDEII